MERFYRVIAGTIELFVGAYFLTFGSLAAVYFLRIERERASWLSVAAALFGVLLIFRAERLLGWKRGLFLFIIVPLLIVPVVWYLPAILSRMR